MCSKWLQTAAHSLTVWELQSLCFFLGLEQIAQLCPYQHCFEERGFTSFLFLKKYTLVLWVHLQSALDVVWVSLLRQSCKQLQKSGRHLSGGKLKWVLGLLLSASCWIQVMIREVWSCVPKNQETFKKQQKEALCLFLPTRRGQLGPWAT